MIKKDTNKSKIKTKSKILVLGLILTILIGSFSPVTKAYAKDTFGTCHFKTNANGIAPPDIPAMLDSSGASKSMLKVTCFDLGSTNKETIWAQLPDVQVDDGYNFDCGGQWSVNPFSYGCLAAFLNLLWSKIAAPIARAAGHFLDFFVYYSTSSSSYSNTFVAKAWGAVRDIANIFFIIALLYVAIKTVLSLDTSGSKKLIGYIIVIALIINFSLFTTKVIIDASNILAKIFYNSIASTNSADSTYRDGTPKQAMGDGGDKSISLGLISKYNPQKIVDQKMYSAGHETDFIFITIIALIITLYTAYIFFSVALLFVARVISLWIAMIFSPLAFISYTVSFDIPGFGHKEWWDDLLKNAFLAPVFVFFLYIIIMFAGFLSTIISYPEGADTTQKMMGIVIPFALMAMLLMKAKKKAVDYSGEMGKAVVKGAQMVGGMVGGMALGAATGGAAFAGRASLGTFMKGASTGDTAAARLEAEGNRRTAGIANWRDVNLTRFQRLQGSVATATGIHALQRGVGVRLNTDQGNIEHAAHARHDLDTAAGVVAPGKKWDDLNGGQRDLARRNVARADAARSLGYGNRTWTQLDDIEQRNVTTRITPLLAANNTVADTWIRDAHRKQGIISNVVQSSVTGTYDARNLANVVAKEQTTSIAKIASGLTGAMAMGLRGGFKQMGVNYGEAQGKLFKDLGSTITEALKSVKINVDLSHVGEVKKEENHGGGGHH